MDNMPTISVEVEAFAEGIRDDQDIRTKWTVEQGKDGVRGAGVENGVRFLIDSGRRVGHGNNSLGGKYGAWQRGAFHGKEGATG